MRPKTIENLQYFLGKVCTILTTPIGRNFDELHAREHFVVRVREINPDGLWGTHPYNETVSFFSIEHIVGINEEIELDPNNPEHKAMITEFEQRSGKKVQSDLKAPAAPPKETAPKPDASVPFVDIRSIQSLAKNTKIAANNLETFRTTPR